MTDKATRRAYQAGQWVQFTVAWLLVLMVAAAIIAGTYWFAMFVHSGGR